MPLFHKANPNGWFYRMQFGAIPIYFHCIYVTVVDFLFSLVIYWIEMYLFSVSLFLLNLYNFVAVTIIDIELNVYWSWGSCNGYGWGKIKSVGRRTDRRLWNIHNDWLECVGSAPRMYPYMTHLSLKINVNKKPWSCFLFSKKKTHSKIMQIIINTVFTYFRVGFVCECSDSILKALRTWSEYWIGCA